MRRLIAVLTVIMLFPVLSMALRADDSTGNTNNSASAAVVEATAVSTPAAITMDNGATTIGGHIKIVLFDTADGVRTTTGGKAMGSTEYGGFNFNELWLYISHQLSDVFAEVEPEFRASTSATPKLGYNVGGQEKASDASFAGFDRALAKYEAPGGYEISAGIVKPIFTMDYGDELFWSEEYNGSKFTANPYLGEMADTGIEVYKAFGIGDASLPVWLYALNGTGGTLESDNNDQPAAMIHVEPEWGMFKLSGSYTLGTYDNAKHDAYQRTSGGLVFNWQALQVRGEYASGRWNNKLSAGNDAVSQGWYAKAVYKFTPWLKVVYDYNVADFNFNYSGEGAANSGEKYLTHTLACDLNITDSSYLMLQLDYADWLKNNGSDELKFIRPVLATRITF